MRGRAFALAAIVLFGAVAPVATAAQGSSSGYAGTHVSYDAEGSAIVDYAVQGETVAESVRVQSRSEADGGLSVGAGVDLVATTDVVGSALSVNAQSGTDATIRSESGATIETHDNEHGSLVVSTDDGAQTVAVGVDASATAVAVIAARGVVRSDGGAEGAFVVAGDGEVGVDDAGNVTATIEEGGRLLVRTYPDGRSDADRTQERLVADGTAAASVHLTADDGETVADAVTYGSDTTVEVTERSAERVAIEVERTSHEGRVVVTSIGEEAMASTDDLRVTVDGEAAVEASSTSELEQAANGGAASKYVVQQRSDASAGADVLVALNHFSTREVAVEDGGDGDGSDADGSDGSGDGDGSNAPGSDGGSDADGGPSVETGPGFGPLATLGAITSLVAGLLARGS